jgi:5-methylthioribose kinase
MTTATAVAHYQTLTTETLVDYLSEIESVTNYFKNDPQQWVAKEMGDGNLNLVFIVTNGTKKLIVKQALPYLRLVGESWPLPLKRSYFEATALTIEASVVPHLVPEIFYADTTMAVIVMEFCDSHIILRKGFIEGVEYPELSEDISSFLAETLFKTSDLYLSARDKKMNMLKFCDNTELCKITEDLVFTHPYIENSHNRWTAPHLDEMAELFQNDTALKLASQRMKEKFLTSAQALIHGDLHSGSVMVTEEATKIIDPEFAFYGPMGFDIGAYIGNVFLSIFSQPAHRETEDELEEYVDWLMNHIDEVWTMFRTKFIELWDEYPTGDCYGAIDEDDPFAACEHSAMQRRYMQRLFQDTLGFAAVKMIRRILGLAHVEDFESIEDLELRSQLEEQALFFARELLLHKDSFSSMSEVIECAELISDDS